MLKLSMLMARQATNPPISAQVALVGDRELFFVGPDTCPHQTIRTSGGLVEVQFQEI